MMTNILMPIRLAWGDSMTTAQTATIRRRIDASRCFGCGRREALLVYLKNGHDYCVACARVIYLELGIVPAGRRWADQAVGESVLQAAATRAKPLKPYLG